MFINNYKHLPYSDRRWLTEVKHVNMNQNRNPSGDTQQRLPWQPVRTKDQRQGIEIWWEKPFGLRLYNLIISRNYIIRYMVFVIEGARVWLTSVGNIFIIKLSFMSVKADWSLNAYPPWPVRLGNTGGQGSRSSNLFPVTQIKNPENNWTVGRSQLCLHSPVKTPVICPNTFFRINVNLLYHQLK